MELTLRAGHIVIDFSEDGKRDVLMASEIARHAARSLTRLAQDAIATRVTPEDSGISLEVLCVLSGSKPLVMWRPGRWVTELLVSPKRALALAEQTHGAAQEAERVAKWTELREPRAFIGQ